MTLWSRRRGGPGRHHAANRRRGERARAHLAQKRQRDLRQRRMDVRQRERARTLGSASDLRGRGLRVALFLLSLGAGVLLSGAIEGVVTSIAGGGRAAIGTIAIQGNDQLDFAHVARATGIVPGSTLADVDPEQVVARLVEDPWIRNANVLRLPPSTLLVRIEERRPLAVLVDESRLRLVDESGTPFSPASAEQAAGLPRLVGGEDLGDGQGHALLLTALGLVERMQAVGSLGLWSENAAELHLPRGQEPEGWQVHVPERGTWVVLGRERLIERFEQLVELLENDEVGRSLSKGARRIDLRFAGQAVLRSALRWEPKGPHPVGRTS